MAKLRLIKRSSILVLIGALCLIEVAARFVLGLGTPPLSIADPEIEYMFRPNQDVMRFGNRQLYNAYGMRSRDFPFEKAAGEYRIICFGDSVLNGGNLTDQSKLATSLLAEHLSKESARSVIVGNISAGSWGPPNMLAYARRYGLFNADQIVVQLSSHDIYDVPTFEPLNPFTHPTHNPCCAMWEGLSRYLPIYIPALKPIFQPTGVGESLSILTQEERDRSANESYRICLQAISDMCDLANAEGADFMIILHAEREEVETGLFMVGHDAFKDWARLHAVEILDLGPAEAESLREGIDIFRENDNIHLSDAGQKLLADQLFDYFSVLVCAGEKLVSASLSSSK